MDVEKRKMGKALISVDTERLERREMDERFLALVRKLHSLIESETKKKIIVTAN